MTDLIMADLAGGRDASARRNEVGRRTGIGYANAKTFLVRLNHYGVTREEFDRAICEMDAREADE
jgi:ribonuclease M5